MSKKKRLDQILVDRGLAETRAKAQALILAGEVLVGDQPAHKAGHSYSTEAVIRLKNEGPRYVSRGGQKLAGALESFSIVPKDLNCLDIGASTGGFTDCLLQQGAKHVTCIDVGKGQLDPKIRHHDKVTWYESFHVKDLTPDFLKKFVDLIVIDVSFISLRKVLPYVLPCLKPNGILLALIKPQFEATRKDLIKGVLKDETKREEILHSMRNHAIIDLRLDDVDIVDCIIRGPKGNLEAFLKAKNRG